MSQSPPPNDSAQPTPSSSPAEQPRPAGGAVLFLIVGLLAGGASFAAVNMTKDHYRIPPELENVDPEDPVATAKRVAAEKEVEGNNLSLAAMRIGLIVGGLIGLAAGIGARSFSRGLSGLLLGLLLGGALGYAAARFAPSGIGDRIDGWMPRTATHEAKQSWLMFRTIAVHGAIWGAIGLAAALAVTLPGRDAQAMTQSGIGALAAALVAMMLYHVLLAGAFGASRFDALLPGEAGPIAAWTLLPAALLGLAIGTLSVPDRTAGE